jgi:hypothetical protein
MTLINKSVDHVLIAVTKYHYIKEYILLPISPKKPVFFSGCCAGITLLVSILRIALNSSTRLRDSLLRA